MKTEKQKLIIEQLDHKLKKFKSLQSVSNTFIFPSHGWINTLRKSLNMSLKQLAKRLNVTSQNVNQLERSEKDGTISIKKLREVAEAMEMKVIYAFIPCGESLEKMIEKRAFEVAKDIVMRTSHSMKLEDQENSRERIQKAIKDRAEKIRNEMPKYLWD